MVTHDLPYPLQLCRRALVMNDGVIVADGPTGEILADAPLMAANRLSLPLRLRPSDEAGHVLAGVAKPVVGPQGAVGRSLRHPFGGGGVARAPGATQRLVDVQGGRTMKGEDQPEWVAGPDQP